MLLTRPAPPALRAVVRELWASAPAAPARERPGAREHALPTGCMHLVFRLSGPPVRLFDSDADCAGRSVGYAVVGGARERFHVRDVSVPTRGIGALLRPGAGTALFGVPDGALAGMHTPLDALWGREADTALERLHALDSLPAQLDLLAALLAERLHAPAAGLHPAVAQALRSLGHRDATVAAAVAASGYSHRRFIALFQQHTGLTPKAYARLQRLDRVLALAADGSRAWAQIALDAGYADQSHLSRDFGAFAGASPSAWRRGAAPESPRHLAR